VNYEIRNLTRVKIQAINLQEQPNITNTIFQTDKIPAVHTQTQEYEKPSEAKTGNNQKLYCSNYTNQGDLRETESLVRKHSTDNRPNTRHEN
jgi:hypothetical protein